jgi:hypothetical protein
MFSASFEVKLCALAGKEIRFSAFIFCEYKDSMNSKLVKLIAMPAAMGILCLSAALPLGAQTQPATITVNAATTLTSFVPVSIFGVNAAYWIPKVNNDAVSTLVKQAGNYFIRFPGGSASDTYHWNGTGSYNANNYWVPSGTTYSLGFDTNMTYVGTTGSNNSAEFPYSYMTDGNTSTRWLSNADTQFPNHQWAQIDLTGAASTVNVSGVSIIWSTPYATSFEVQYWTGVDNAVPYQANDEADWADFAGGNITGSPGGTTSITFTTAKSTRYIRILLTASSAGAGGAYSIAEAYAYNGAALIGNNEASTSQNKVVVSSTDPASSTVNPINNSWTTDFNSFMAYAHSFSSGPVTSAIPLITVNYGTGTPSEAASWVNYANKQMGYGIKYWQVGNEQDGIWECGGPTNAKDYAYRFTEFYNAMTAVDPTIIVTGPVVGGPYDSSNAYDGQPFIQTFLSELQTLGATADLDALDYHWYPWNYGTTTTAVEINTASQVAAFAVSLNSWETAAGVNTNTPVIMSEYNISPNTPLLMNQLPTGLWLANWLGEFIHYFGSHGNTNLWDSLNGTAVTSNTGDQGYLQVEAGTYQYQPRANYWAMQIMANDWAIPADTNAHQLISTGVTVASGASTLLATYSDYRPDGVFSLMVVNKDPTNSYNTWVTGLPFNPSTTANEWTFSSANYVWTSSGSPTTYYASPDTAPTTVTLTDAATSFPVTFAPYSINVIQFTNSNLPTSIPTSPPTATATKTSTNSPTAILTGTATASPTNSPTASFTGTPTLSPTVTYTGTPTNSPTVSNTFTLTLTPTNSPTASFTGTPTLSPTVTFTGTPTNSSTASNTFTLTSTPTNSYTPTLTQTSTSTPTATPTNTICMDAFGNTCTLSPTPLATATFTDTPTNSPTWTATATSTPTSSFTPSATFTSTVSSTATSSPTVTLSFTPTQSPTPTSTPGLTGIFPNPFIGTGPVKLSYQLSGSADQVEVKVFTLAFRKIFEDDSLATASGGHLYTLNWGLNNLNVADGLYYVVLIIKTGGSETHKVMKLLAMQ